MSIIASLSAALATGGLLAFPLAFVGGVAMGFNPCCIALYPAAAATCCTGTSGDRPPPRMQALAFVLGTAIAMMALGLAAAVAGRTLMGLGRWASYLAAVVPLIMGLHLVGWLRLPMPSATTLPRLRGVGGAFLAGLLLALVLGPCGTPVLAAILSYAAYKGSAWYGALLLFSYGLGSGLPLLLIGLLSGGVAQRFAASRRAAWVERLAGVVFLGLGFYLLGRA